MVGACVPVSTTGRTSRIFAMMSSFCASTSSVVKVEGHSFVAALHADRALSPQESHMTPSKSRAHSSLAAIRLTPAMTKPSARINQVRCRFVVPAMLHMYTKQARPQERQICPLGAIARIVFRRKHQCNPTKSNKSCYLEHFYLSPSGALAVLLVVHVRRIGRESCLAAMMSETWSERGQVGKNAKNFAGITRIAERAKQTAGRRLECSFIGTGYNSVNRTPRIQQCRQ